MKAVQLAFILSTLLCAFPAFPVRPLPVHQVYNPATAANVANGQYDSYAPPMEDVPRSLRVNVNSEQMPYYAANPYSGQQDRQPQYRQQQQYGSANPSRTSLNYPPEPSPEGSMRETLHFRPSVRYDNSRFEVPPLLPPPSQQQQQRQYRRDPRSYHIENVVRSAKSDVNETASNDVSKKTGFGRFFQSIASALFGSDMNATEPFEEPDRTSKSHSRGQNQTDRNNGINSIRDSSSNHYGSYYHPQNEKSDNSNGYRYPAYGSGYTDGGHDTYRDGLSRSYINDYHSASSAQQPQQRTSPRGGRGWPNLRQQQQPPYSNTDFSVRDYPSDRQVPPHNTQMGAANALGYDSNNNMDKRFQPHQPPPLHREYTNSYLPPPDNLPRDSNGVLPTHRDPENRHLSGRFAPFMDAKGGADFSDYDSEHPSSGALSKSEAQEMVRLFRRFFETLDNSIQPSSGSHSSSNGHSDIVANILSQAGRIGDETVRMAVPHGHENTAGPPEVDRDEMINANGQHHVNLDDDDILVRAQAAAARASNLVEEHVPDIKDRERDRGDADLKHLDENGAMEGLPASAPAYGTRKKLLQKQADPGALDDVLNHVSSAIWSNI